MKRVFLMLVLALFAMGSVVGCGETKDDGKGGTETHTPQEHSEEDPAEDACGHLKETKVTNVSAGSDAGGATEISKGHTNYQVTLPKDDNGKKVGYLKFSTTKPGAFYLATDKRVTIEFVNDSGMKAEPAGFATGTTTPKCNLVESYVTVPNLPAQAWKIKLRADAANATFKLVYLPAGSDEHDHDHDEHNHDHDEHNHDHDEHNHDEHGHNDG